MEGASLALAYARMKKEARGRGWGKRAGWPLTTGLARQGEEHASSGEAFVPTPSPLPLKKDHWGCLCGKSTTESKRQTWGGAGAVGRGSRGLRGQWFMPEGGMRQSSCLPLWLYPHPSEEYELCLLCTACASLQHPHSPLCLWY